MSILPNDSAEVPPGFQPLARSSAFLDLLGPLWQRPAQAGADQTLTLGLHIRAQHCNASGNAHGGLLATLADVGLGYATAFSREPAVRLTTVSLNLDYCGTARQGDWLEVHSRILRLGRQMAFAEARLCCAQRTVARASAVFHIPGG